MELITWNGSIVERRSFGHKMQNIDTLYINKFIIIIVIVLSFLVSSALW
jgi:hypothetical protein